AVLFASAGQATLVPVHVSVRSHPPAAARHTVSAGTRASAGQSFVTPSQRSATSQAPAAARHSAVLLASGGQAGLAPAQNSGTSQTQAASRHRAPAWPAGCWQASAIQSSSSAVTGFPVSMLVDPSSYVSLTTT